MADDTRIEWTDATWNPVRGCSRVSEGCRNCYAERVAARFSGPGMPYEGLAADGKWTGKVRLVPEKLDQPLRWTKPRRIFVNSMSDLFHEALSFEEIAAVFAVMALAAQHTFQVLTKRPERMRDWLRWVEAEWKGLHPGALPVMQDSNGVLKHAREERVLRVLERENENSAQPWPLPNVWLGVSCEDQKAADERISLLLQTPAAVRFVSAEPLLGPVDFTRIDRGSCCEIDALHGSADVLHDATLPREGIKIDGLDWLIVGGESGHGARPCEVAWVRSIVRQCREAGVPCFVKQLGSHPVVPHPTHPGDPNYDQRFPLGLRDRKGGAIEEWPEDLRVREFPR